MGVAVTLCTQPEHERRENENHHSFFRGSEKESLSGLIEFGTPAFFQFSLILLGWGDASKMRRARRSSPAIIGLAALRRRCRAVV